MPRFMKIPPTGSMLVPVELYTDDRLPTDDRAMRQLCDGASLPAVMRVIGTPDIHCGYGVPIGCVLAMEGRVVPAAAGYDINCGMLMILTNLPADRAMASSLANAVRSPAAGRGKVQSAFSQQDFLSIITGGLGGLDTVALGGYPFAARLTGRFPVTDVMSCAEHAGSLPSSCAGVSKKALDRGSVQLGTLGGGNHFVEFQHVERILRPGTAEAWGIEKDTLAVMLHSGSRGFGHEIAAGFLKGPGMTVLNTESTEGRQYLQSMRCAANFAYVNRYFLASLVATVLLEREPCVQLKTLADISHNMVFQEDGLMVHRKGATAARGPSAMNRTTGQTVLIPGSMGTASYVLEGRDGSAATLHSVNHGAGRLMGRREALGRKKGNRTVREPGVTPEAFEKSMEGIELICENPRTIREEAPQAYKDIETVVEVVAHFDLAIPVCRLVPLAVLKG